MLILIREKVGKSMIDYSPFWNTLERSNENWYTLTNKHHLSHSTLHRLKHNKDISMKTINDAESSTARFKTFANISPPKMIRYYDTEIPILKELTN